MQNFLDFCHLCFINSFIVKNNFGTVKLSKVEIAQDPISFEKIFMYHFEDFICTNNLEGFFFQSRMYQEKMGKSGVFTL